MGSDLGRDWRRGEYSVATWANASANEFKAPEGPHIYHKDGFYYLLVAEGMPPHAPQRRPIPDKS